MNQNKPQWTCTNQKGDKFFYYPQVGWISAGTGAVAGFDLTGAAEPKAPDDATHVQVAAGKVQYVKQFAEGFVSVWHGEWVSVGFMCALKGTVVTLADGYVGKRDASTPVMPCGAAGWHSGKPTCMDCLVEVRRRSGAVTTRIADKYDWVHTGGASDIMRWRYV